MSKKEILDKEEVEVVRKDSEELKEIINSASKEAENISNSSIDSMAKQFGVELSKEKKVKIKIPISDQNPDDKVVPVCINGYCYFINRGEKVEVPECVSNILEEAGYI